MNSADPVGEISCVVDPIPNSFESDHNVLVSLDENVADLTPNSVQYDDKGHT